MLCCVQFNLGSRKMPHQVGLIEALLLTSVGVGDLEGIIHRDAGFSEIFDGIGFSDDRELVITPG